MIFPQISMVVSIVHPIINYHYKNVKHVFFWHGVFIVYNH